MGWSGRRRRPRAAGATRRGSGRPTRRRRGRRGDDIPANAAVAPNGGDEQDHRERVHGDALEPAQPAGHVVGDLGEVQAAGRRHGGDEEGDPQGGIVDGADDRRRAAPSGRRRSRATTTNTASAAAPMASTAVNTCIASTDIGAKYGAASRIWASPVSCSETEDAQMRVIETVDTQIGGGPLASPSDDDVVDGGPRAAARPADRAASASWSGSRSPTACTSPPCSAVSP